MNQNLNVNMSTTAQATVEVQTGQTEPSAPVLAARNASVGFGGKTVLTGVGVDFAKGTITAVIGPTGCGKSTLLRSFNRMNDKTSGYWRTGSIELDGSDVSRKGVDLLDLRRRVGMVFQRPNPFPMSIRDNVVAGVKAHRIARRGQLDVIAERRLQEVGLWDAVKDRLGDSPFRLSGGQQQLLCLARALAVGPDILLLDEPTSSLDPMSTEAIEHLLATLAPALTLVVVTHNLAQARRLSHETVLFFDGTLVERGPTAELFANPRDPRTQRYVSGRIG